MSIGKYCIIMWWHYSDWELRRLEPWDAKYGNMYKWHFQFGPLEIRREL